MKVSQVIKLLNVYLFLSLTSVCTKWASASEFLSWQYIVGILGAVTVLGLYAIIWQQMLKKLPLSTAYIFKGVGVIFTLLYSVLLFGEIITWTNIIGAILIVVGITLYAKEDKQ